MTIPIDAPERATEHAPAPTLRHAPVRSLAERHRPRIVAHLLALGAADRYLRFGHPATDAQIARYVDQIDFENDEVLGIFNRRLEVVALAHLAYLGAPGVPQKEAEFGVSVSAHARGRGWGRRLFDLSVLHARNRRVETLLVHALSENKAMLHIAAGAGATVVRDGPESTARLQLPPEDFASHMEALIEHQVAEFDYGLKVHARRFDEWLRLLSGARPPSTGIPQAGALERGAFDPGDAPPAGPPV